MYRRIICMLIIVCVGFTGCGIIKPKKNFEEAGRGLLKLEAYTCDVVLKVTNNRSTMEYRLKHSYKSPDKYRVEVLAPRELQGQVTIYNGNSSYVYHPGINQYFVTEDFSGSVEYNSFVGSFMEHIRKTDEMRISYEKYGDKECIVAEFQIPEPNRYMHVEKLWIDRSEIVPLKAEIYGNDGKTYIEIFYNNFVCNPSLKDRDFEIIQKNSMKLQEMRESVRSEENQSRMGGSGSGCSCSQHEGNQEAC
jgi:outer membrane lipoprotein-sorting protein